MRPGDLVKVDPEYWMWEYKDQALVYLSRLRDFPGQGIFLTSCGKIIVMGIKLVVLMQSIHNQHI